MGPPIKGFADPSAAGYGGLTGCVNSCTMVVLGGGETGAEIRAKHGTFLEDNKRFI